MTVGGSEQKVGSSNKDNQPPATTTGSFFYLNFYATDINQWDYSYKFPNRSVKKCSIVVSFSSDAANYTHEVIY